MNFVRACIVVFLCSAAARAAPSAREILDKVDDLYRGSSSHGKLTMKVVTAHWTRELTLEEWSRGKEKSLIRILAPEKEAGTATLKVGADIWNYLPKVNRVVKVPSSMMSGAWMGSHFTNDDLVKSSRMADDFDCASAPVPQGLALTCTPKKDAPVVWGRVVVTVRKEDDLPLSIDYFDEDLKPARKLEFSDLRKLGGRTLPMIARMVPSDKPGEMTEIRYEDLAFDVNLPDDLFTLRNLQR